MIRKPVGDTAHKAFDFDWKHFEDTIDTDDMHSCLSQLAMELRQLVLRYRISQPEEMHRNQLAR